VDTVNQLHINIACEYASLYISAVTGLRAGEPFPISSSNTNFSSSLPCLVHSSLRSPGMKLTTEFPSSTQIENCTDRNKPYVILQELLVFFTFAMPYGCTVPALM